VFYLVLACILRFAAGINLRGEVNRIVTRLLTKGDVVLRLQGSGLCDLKPDRCVAPDQIDSYLEPDGRSGITFPSHTSISLLVTSTNQTTSTWKRIEEATMSKYIYASISNNKEATSLHRTMLGQPWTPPTIAPTLTMPPHRGGET
jgi:hypothetical protein